MSRREPTVRARLVVLVLSILAPIAFIAGASALSAWHGARQAIERELEAEARALATDVVQRLDVSRNTLLALATSPSLAAHDLVAFQKQVEAAPRPPGARILLTDPSGQIVVNSRVPFGTPLTPRGDQEHVHRVFAAGQPQVSDLYTGPATRQNLVALDVPVVVDGRTIYALNLSFPPDVLAEVLVRRQLADGRLVSIIDGKGLILARSAGMETFVGRPVAASSIEAFRRGEGLYVTTSQEGFPLLAANARVPGTGWRVAVSTRRDVLETALLRSLGTTAALVAALLAVGLGIAAYHARRLTRPLEALARAVKLVGEGGNPPAIPPGVREASRAGAALAASVAALRLRERERDVAEAAQRRGEARLARLMQTTPAGVIEIDAGGQFLYANAAAERILGAEQGGLAGRRFDDPAWRAPAPGPPIPPGPTPLAAGLEGRVVNDAQHTLTTLDGRRAVLLLDVVPIRDGDGRMEGVLAAFQDVTARHAAVQALRETEARFRHLADSAPALIWMTDARGQVTFANMHFDHMFGRPARELLGNGWITVLLPDAAGPFRAAFRAAFAARAPFRHETRVRDKAGQVRWLRCDGVPRLDDAGTFLGYTGCGVDITEARLAAGELEARIAGRTAELQQAVSALNDEARERAAAEAQLRHAQKIEAVGQLTGGIAHDFNNMLQAIGGSLDLIRRRMEQRRADEAAPLVDAARRTVDRAAALTHRLLAFARRQALQPRPVQPNALIEGMEDLIRRTAGPRIDVRLALDAGAWTVLCDPNQLESAILNLAINARDAMEQGGVLTIATRNTVLTEAEIAGQDNGQPGEHVEIAVADTGAGMDEETRLRAFEPFFTTKPMGQGTGLGLSQLYGFVRQSGGAVRLDSAPGAGTTVRIALPRHGAQAHEPERAAPETEQAGAGQVVLLVEDEPDVRTVTAEHLRELGYAVLDAEDSAGALALLRGGARPDVLVTDVGLPGALNGRQLADAAREQWPGLPVLFITGYAGTALDDRLAAGMEVLVKPFTLGALTARIGALLPPR